MLLITVVKIAKQQPPGDSTLPLFYLLARKAQSIRRGGGDLKSLEPLL